MVLTWTNDSYSAGQNIPCLLWDQKLHSYVGKNCHWTALRASYMSSTPSYLIYLITTLILSSIYAYILYKFLISHMRTVCPVHLSLFHLIALTAGLHNIKLILSFPHFSVTSSFLDYAIPPSTLSQTTTIYCVSWRRVKFHTVTAGKVDAK